MIMAGKDTVIRKVMYVEGKRGGVGEKKAGTLERRMFTTERKAKQSLLEKGRF